MTIVCPSDYFNKKKPDEIFLDQVEAFRNLGFEVTTVSLDELKMGKQGFIRTWFRERPLYTEAGC